MGHKYKLNSATYQKRLNEIINYIEKNMSASFHFAMYLSLLALKEHASRNSRHDTQVISEYSEQILQGLPALLQLDVETIEYQYEARALFNIYDILRLDDIELKNKIIRKIRIGKTGFPTDRDVFQVMGVTGSPGTYKALVPKKGAIAGLVQEYVYNTA